MVALISLAACAHLTPAPSGRSENPPAVQPPERAAPARETATPEAAVAPAPSVAATDRSAGADAPSKAGPGHPSAAKPQNSPEGRVTATKIAPSTSTGPTENKQSPGGGDAPPPLGLNQLEQRLRDTHAIGVFTKLSLKNQIDDLLDQFRAYHLKESGASLAELRKRYEALLHKVIDLLQSDDASLAQAIWSSREAIWSILTDPAKVSQL
jgi:hypothetical protein